MVSSNNHHLLVFTHSHSSLPHWIPVYPIRYCRNNIMWFPRLVQKSHLASALFLHHSLWEKAVACEEGTHRDISHDEEVIPPTESQPATDVIKPSWKWIFTPQSSPHMNATPTYMLTVTSWKIPSQNHSAKLLLNFKSTEIAYDNKLLVEVTRIWGGNLLCNNRQLKYSSF